MKSKSSKQKNTPNSNNEELPTIGKKLAVTIFWTIVVIVGLWSLMHFSTPKTKLEPYTKFKKTSTTFENTSDKEVSNEKVLERFAETKQSNPLDIATPDPETKPKNLQLPRKTLEHIQKGMQLIEDGKFNSADLEFKKAAQISPDSPEVFALWGTALRVQKKYKGANRHFAKAMKLSPNDAEIAFNWGVSRFREKATGEAIKLFLKTVELNPSYHMGWYYLGKAYGQINNLDKEIEYLLKVTNLRPDFGWGHFDLAIALSLKKKFEEAAPYFEKAISIDKEQFEKPFVVQFLTALGRYTPTPPKKEKKNTPAPASKEAKADTSATKQPQAEEIKPEGSDHKMDEGSKLKKATTNVKGTMLVNGESPGSNAVIFLETKTKMKSPNQQALKITIDQNKLQFSPKHTVVPIGSSVSFSNQDVEVHNIFSKSLNNQFNLGAMSSGAIKTISLLKPGPIVLRCNLHKDMVGTIFVVPNGYYTQPDKQGKYGFKDIKSAGYIMQAWAPHLAPGDVEANLKTADLTGENTTFNFDIKTTSLPEEIHDMIDSVDYNAIVDNIDHELEQAIKDWESGKKYVSRKRALMAITKYYDGRGLKGALAKSFSEKRSQNLEDKLDEIRKIISGIGTESKLVTSGSLRQKAAFAISQLRNNVQELKARLNPDSIELR